MSNLSQESPPPLLARTAPALFVLLWSTGFIGAKLGLPYADAMTFLALRFAIVLAILTPVVLLFGRIRMSQRELAAQAATGFLMHAVYLGGVFWAIGEGVSAGLAALIVGLQPALTALMVGPVLGESIGRWAAIGFPIGLLGVALVVLDGAQWRLDALIAPEAGAVGYISCALALIGMSAALLVQKRFGAATDPWAGQWVQAAVAGAALGLAAFAVGELRVTWTGEFIFALGWLVLALSIGAVGLLLALIRMGAASKTASLFFLTPPVTAAVAWALFDERLGLAGLVGFAVAALGVWLARR